MAPRPVTPSQNQTLRSASAPNSPARGFGLFGSGRSSPHHHFPPQIDHTNSAGSGGGGSINLPSFAINRLPSQDSLDRSIHNESGHGKSTAQIIRDLKHSNSALSAKMATMERRHMNELAQVEGSTAKRRKELDMINAKQKMKLMQYEQYKTAAESKMKQQDTELTKVKEESAFQRHTISDLKNQLYQLQQELDERDEDDESRPGDDDDDDDIEEEDGDHDLRRPHSGDRHNLPLHPSHTRSNSGGLLIAPTSSSMSTDDLQQMALDNEELVKEIQELQDQLMEYQGYDKKLKDLQRQLEAAQRNSSDMGIPPRPTTPTHPLNKGQPERERPPLAPSKSRDQDEAQQLQDARGELEAHKQKLLQRESSVRDLEQEKVALVEAHEQRVQELEDRYLDLEEEWKEQESALRKELESRSQENTDEIEARVRAEQQVQIVELEEQLEQYAEKLAQVAATLAESRQQAKTQEQYRKDEAEDLRMILDSHEADIVRLEKELDEARRELELRDEELEEIKQKYVLLVQKHGKEDEKKIEETETKALLTTADGVESEQSSDSNAKLISDLEEELYNSVNTVNALELQLEELRKERDEMVVTHEADKAKLISDLGAAAAEKDEGLETADLHKLWEQTTTKTKEVKSLKDEIENMRHRVQESTETARLAEQKVQELQKQLQDHESDAAAKDSDSNDLSEKLKLAQTQVVDSNKEIAMLTERIEELRSLSSENQHMQEQLQEAQIALISLDDEKQALHDELSELKLTLENERKEIQNEMETQLKLKETELAELQKVKDLISPLEAEKLRLEDEVKTLKEAKTEDSEPIAPINLSRSMPDRMENLQLDLERQIEELKEEKSLINSKLKDRDTTIATLLRSSMVLERKIGARETELRESRDNHEKAVAELKELRSAVNSNNEDFSKFGEEMKYLKRQLKIAKTDAKRWKRALQDDGTTSGEYRYQISMLQKANEDYADTVQERDHAIQNLVNQSMGQEKHIRDLKIRISSLMKEVESVRMNKGRNDENALRAEIDRLQDESEIFAGQIIEQDEEFKRMQRVLKDRDEQIRVMKNKIGATEESDIPNDSALEERDRQILDLQEKIKSLETQESDKTVIVDSVEFKNLQAELDEMQEAAESNRVELRDLRQQLWEAKAAAGSANDLRVQLEQAKWAFDEYKRKNSSETISKNDSELQTNLDKSLSRIKELEALLSENPQTETKLTDLETELQARETVIKELREQLSGAWADTQRSNIEGSEAELKSKVEEIRILNEELNASQRELNDTRELLQSKTTIVTELTNQVEEYKEEVSVIRGQLQASASTATDLAIQTKASQEEIEAMREVISAKTEAVNSLNEEVSELQSHASGLRTTVEEKTGRIEQLEAAVNILTNDINNCQKQLDSKTDSIDDLDKRLRDNEVELKEAKNLKLKLGSDLADSQARLGALEKELSNAITETSSNEELARKNQSLVQENASLAQKSKSLAEENALLENANENLMEESETLTNDNQILCHELQTLDQLNHTISEDKENLERDVESLSKTVAELRNENESLIDKRNKSEHEIMSLSKSGAEEKNSLKRELDTLSQANDSLTEENRALVEKNITLTQSIESLKEKNMSLEEKGVKMEKEMEFLTGDMDALSKESSKLQELQLQLDGAQRQREEMEKAIIENYEKQMTSLSSSKDTEIDNLRNSLTASREKNAESMGEIMAQLKSMEQENSDLRVQFELELRAKDQQIYALEQTLHAQEQTVETMRTEMDQIQSGMQHATSVRRGEVEEMQQEVMQMEEKAMKQEREIVALKMQLEERKLEHKADVVKLKDALAKAMDHDSPLKKTIFDLQNNDRMLEVRERLELLKKRNTDLQEENLNLGGRLERAAIQINAFELEKQQAEEIEEENMKLRKQLKEYEQLLSQSAKSSRSAPSPKAKVTDKETTTKTKDKKKKKFGLFKRRAVDGSILEEKEEEECLN